MTAPPLQDALPLELTSFIGREVDLQRLSESLARDRLVTIAGTGGIGKTRMAVRLARMTASRWSDGVVFADLAPLRPGESLEAAIHQALGGSQQSANAREALLQRIADQHVLIVVDNCEHVVHDAASVVEAMLRSCPNLHILATSRRTLGIPGEFVWRLSPLPLPSVDGNTTSTGLASSPATALFLDRAGRVRPGLELTPADAEAVARVCTALDGVPLAIELAAARLRLFSIPQLAERIHEQLPLLTGGSRVGPARQQTMRAAIAWSHDQLNEQERLLFRRLAVFSGGWSLEAAEGICGGDGIDGGQVLDLLDSLVDSSLVVADADVVEARFRFLFPILEFARAELLASGEAEAFGARHCRWMAALVGRAEPHLLGPAEQFWSDRLEQDFDNLLAAMAWAESHRGEIQAGLRMVGGLQAFWIRSGRFAQAYAWSRRLLSAAGTTFPSARVGALESAAHFGHFIDPDEGKRYAREGVALARELGEPGPLAHCLQKYGSACFWSGDIEEAMAASREALSILEGQPEQGILFAQLLIDVGSEETEVGGVDAAEAAFMQALDVARACGSARLRAQCLNALGEISRLRGDYQRAETRYREALGAGGFASGFLGAAMLNLGFTQLITHDVAGARDSLCTGLQQGLRLQQRNMLVFGLLGMAAVEAASGDASAAARWLGAIEHGRAGVAVQSTDRPVFDLAHQTAQRRLGSQYAIEMEAGRELSLVDAAREALASTAPSRQATAATAPSRISARETEVLRLLAEGASNREIADRLVLSTRTVETHLANLYAKLGARSRVEALRLAVESGLLSLAPQEPPAPGKN